MERLSDYIFIPEDAFNAMLEKGIAKVKGEEGMTGMKEKHLVFNPNDIPLFRGPDFKIEKAFLVMEKIYGPDALKTGDAYTLDELVESGIAYGVGPTLVIGKSRYWASRGYVGRKVPQILTEKDLPKTRHVSPV